MNEDEIEKKILENCTNADVMGLSNKTGLKPNEVWDFIETIQKNKEIRKLIVLLTPVNNK